MYDVYYIMPKLTNHFGDEAILGRWRALFGQNVLLLEDPNGICELIASTVGIAEGVVDLGGIEKDLADAGSSKAISRAVSNALVPVTSGAGAKGTLAIAGSGVTSGLAKP